MSRRDADYYGPRNRRVSIRPGSDRGADLRRVLRECVAMPNAYMIGELEQAGVRAWQDIAFLYPPTIERLTTVQGVDKAKLHFLAEVLSKDPSFVPFNCGPHGVRRRLGELASLHRASSERKSKNEMVLKYARKLTLPGFNGKMDQWPIWKKQVENHMKRYRLSQWLEYVDKENMHWEDIDLTIHSALYDAVSARNIQQMIDSNKSSSGARTWKIVQKWFADNGGDNMTIEKAMNELEMLVLIKNSTASSYIANFTDIMGRLELAGASLPISHQIRKFIKGIMDPHYSAVVNKIREIMQEGKKISITDYYSRLRSEENWINEQAVKFSKMGGQDEMEVQVGAMGRYEKKMKPESENDRVFGDRRWYFKDKNNATAFFPLYLFQYGENCHENPERKCQSGG